MGTNWDYVTQLLLSMLVFGPGVIILAFSLMLGVLMVLEKLGAFRARRRKAAAWDERLRRAARETNPGPGRVIAGLKRSLERPETLAGSVSRRYAS